MAKLTLSPLSNLNSQSSAVATINANMEAIEEAMENTLSRDGTSPNPMQSELDMNGYSIINAITTDDPSSLVSRETAETLFNEIFEDNYEDVIASIISGDTMGWSPVFAVVQDDTRRVLELVDWTGGEENKPTLLGYVGETGIVEAIEDATDIRGETGAAGAGSGDMLAANNLSDLTNMSTARDNLQLSDGATATKATEAEAIAGTSNIAWLSPFRLMQWYDAWVRTDSVQNFTASGTWTKPAWVVDTDKIEVEIVAGGGGGSSTTYGGGGGGGCGLRYTILASEVGATASVTVGSGGGLNTAGGSSQFGSGPTVGGGGAGGHEASGIAGGGGGGGGGGINASGTTGASTVSDNGAAGGNGGGLLSGAGGAGGLASGTPSGSNGVDNFNGAGGGGGGADGTSVAHGGNGGNSIQGGGGGGGGAGADGEFSAQGGDGGSSIFGGGGGGGGASGGAGGTSVFAGAGGSSGIGGTIPGGGGGRGAAGARGRVVVRVVRG